jgi:hypothetical protein
MSNVNLTLSKDEALVLFELLSRFSEEEKLETKYKSEEQVLWNVQANLEKLLSEPFSKEYSTLLDIARKKLTYV